MGNKNEKPVYEFPLMNEVSVGTEWDMKCSYYRGKIIHYTIELEDLTEYIIMEYFIESKDPLRGSNFRAAIMTQERFNLMFKFMVLSFIIRNELPDFIKDHPHFLVVYEELIEQRNRFAHHKFVNAQQFEDDTILMLAHPKPKNGQIDLSITIMYEEFLQRFYGRYFQIKSDLSELLKLVKELNKKGDSY